MRVRIVMAVATGAVLAGCAGMVRADVGVAKVFGDWMVLQRGMGVAVWGRAAAGEQVTVDFAGQEKSATADGAGKWRVVLDKMDADGEGREMVVKGSGGGPAVTLKDVVVGDVWVCAGQSNMEYPLDRTQMRGVSAPPAGVEDVSKEALAEATAKPDGGLRIFHVEKGKLSEELPNDGWHVAAGEELGKFSAIGYFFGKDLRADVKVPIGLIGSYWGGSRIELWTPAEAYEGTKLASEGTAATRPGVIDGSAAGRYSKTMIAPMAGYGIKGMIWYQGESNLIDTNNKDYLEKFALFAKAWRGAWGEGDFPIGTVQIAPYAYTRRKDAVAHTAEALPELWAMQEAATEQVKNVGMVETVDLADSLGNIHPWNKWEVGARLAKWARAEVYGESGVEWSGPVFHGLQGQPGKLTLMFDHGAGLKGAGGKGIEGFEVEGADQRWRPAEAKVVGDGKVEIEAGLGQSDTRGVRYGWREDFRGGLVNGAGLPAVSFEKEW
ncbi:MAG TPA: sialate O-acetylesterase [Phycisphaerae bacterium]|nr:sialate O-acetylesterase [Phycisphaerae bacterium]